MNAREIQEWLQKGQEDFTREGWQDARAAFERVLDAAPNDEQARKAATAGRERVLKKQQVQAEIDELLNSARSDLAAGQYTAAQAKLNQARALCTAHETMILKPIGVIDPLLTDIQERLRQQDKVQMTVREARHLEKQQQSAEAIERLSTLLEELAAAGFAELGAPAHSERERLLGDKDFEQRFAAAKAAFEQQDYTFAQRLLDDLARHRPNDERILTLQRSVSAVWNNIHKKLSRVEVELGQGHFENAVALLQQLRRDEPKNPDWQLWWQQAHMEQGRTCLERGRHALQSYSFGDAPETCQQAQRDFEAARQAFQDTLAVFPEHRLAEVFVQESDTLQAVAGYVVSAARAIQKRSWEDAAQALSAARERLAQAATQPGEARQFQDVEQLLQLVQARVQGMGDRIQQARIALSEGKSKLVSNELGQATTSFEQGIAAVAQFNDELLAQLQAGLDEATRRQNEVAGLLKQAEDASLSAEQRLRLYRQVYDRWPTAAGMPQVWVESLLHAAEQSPDEEQAARYYTQVTQIAGAAPKHVAFAQAKLQRMDARHALQGALQQAERRQADLRSLPLPSQQGYQEVVALLQTALQAAGDDPELRQQVAVKLQTAHSTLQRVEEALTLLGQAESLQQTGDWQAAADTGQRAWGALKDWRGEVPAPQLQQKVQTWAQIATSLAERLVAVDVARERAQKQYEVLAEGNLVSVPLAALSTSLQQAHALLQDPPAGATPLPAEWHERDKEVADLTARLQVLRSAQAELQKEDAIAALQILNGALGERPKDRVLQALRTKLHSETRAATDAQIQKLLSEADAFTERGEWENALVNLRKANQLDKRPEIDQRLSALERQKSLWEAIQVKEADANAKRSTNSPEAALLAFRQVLELAQNADSGLPADARDLFSDLLALEKDLHAKEASDRARQLLEQMRKMAGQHRLVQRLALAVRNWLEIATDAAREGLVTSSLSLGQLLEAYRAAQEYVIRSPGSQRARQLATDTRSQVQNSLLQSLQKRIARAIDLSGKGASAEAIQALKEIESTVLAGPEQAFPEIIDFDLITEARQEAQDLLRELEPAQEAISNLAPLVSQVRAAYTNNDLVQIGNLLKQARAVDPYKRAKGLWIELQGLQVLIEESRQEMARSRVQEVVRKAESGLPLTSDAPAADTIFQTLSEMQPYVNDLDEQGADSKLRQRYENILKQTEERHKRLKQEAESLKQETEIRKSKEQALAYMRELANKALASNDLKQLQIAKKGLSNWEQENLLSGEEMGRVQATIVSLDLNIQAQQRDSTQKEQEEQRRREREMQRGQAWQNAHAAYQGRRFDEALRLLEEAQRLGQAASDVQPYQQAARAGLLLEKAQSLLTRDPHEARRLFNDVLEKTLACAPADPLRHDAEVDLRQADALIQRQVEAVQSANQRQAQIATLLREAKEAYSQRKLDTTREKLNQLIPLQPEHPEAVALRDRLDQDAQVEAYRSEALTLDKAGNYAEALSKAQNALQVSPNLPSLRLLVAELQQHKEADDHLVSAKRFAEAKDFEQAEIEVSQAVAKHPRHPHLTEMQGTIAEEKKNWQREEKRTFTSALDEAEEAHQNRNYPLELEEYRKVSIPNWSAERKAEIERRQQIALHEWALQIKAEIQNALATQKPLSDLTALDQQVQEVLKRNPAAEDKDLLQEMLYRIQVVRLNERFKQAQTALQAQDLATAEVLNKEIKQDSDSLYAKADALALPFSEQSSAGELRSLWRQASNLEVQIASLKDEQKAKARQSDLAQARTWLQAATTLDELEQAKRLTQSVIDRQKPQSDAAAQGLLSEVEDAIAGMNDTNIAHRQALTLMSSGYYGRAKSTLERLQNPAKSLTVENRRLLQLATELDEAKNRQDREPELALSTYLDAQQREPRLKESLEDAVQRARDAAWKQTRTQLDQQLSVPTSNLLEVKARLLALRDEGRVPPSAKGQFDTLVVRIDSRQAIAAARAALQKGDMTQAEQHLRQARAFNPPNDVVMLIDGWFATAATLQALAQAQQTLTSDDLSTAQNWNRRIPSMLAEENLVKHVQADLTACTEKVTALNQAERDVRTALSAAPPNFEQAVQSAVSARLLTPQPHARAQTLVEEVSQALQQVIAQQRSQERYTEAVPLLDRLQMLLPADPLPGQLRSEIDNERVERLKQAISDGRQALGRDALAEVERQLQRAERLNGSMPNPDITALRQDLDKRSTELGEITTRINQARRAIAQGERNQAVNNALEAQRIAPYYDPVQELVTDLRNLLQNVARSARATRYYDDALATCDLALQLGSEDTLNRLRREIAAEQKAAADEACQHFASALASLNLPEAHQALNELGALQPNHPRILGFSESFKQADRAAPKLRDTLLKGWSAFHNRKFDEAFNAFTDAADSVSAVKLEFAEPSLWQRYIANLKDGTRFGQEGTNQLEPGKFLYAAGCFEGAERGLRIPAMASLSPLWGEQLRKERVQAIYYAWRLRSCATNIDREQRLVKELRSQNNPQEMMEAVSRAQEYRRAFISLLETIPEPPDDFDPLTQVQSGAQSRPPPPPPPPSPLQRAPQDNSAPIMDLGSVDRSTVIQPTRTPIKSMPGFSDGQPRRAGNHPSETREAIQASNPTSTPSAQESPGVEEPVMSAGTDVIPFDLSSFQTVDPDSDQGA